MTETRQLLHEIEAFLATAEMAESTFGRKAVNDGKLVGRLRAGSTVTLEIAGRIRQYIRDNTPTAGTPPTPDAPSGKAAA